MAIGRRRGALGVSVPNDLSIGGILEGLGFPADTEALTLSDLFGGLGLSDLPLDLGNVGSLDDLTVSGLLTAAAWAIWPPSTSRTSVDW